MSYERTDIYAFMSTAGSTGKTTSLVTLAIMLAQRGFTVRVVDLDPQANASTWLGYPEHSGLSTADLWDGKSTIREVEQPARLVKNYNEDDEPVYEPIENLTLVPADGDKLEVVLNMIPATLGGATFLREAFEADSGNDQPDIVLIDAPGQRGSAFHEAAALATSVAEVNKRKGAYGVITVTKAAGKEAEGLVPLEKKLGKVRKAYRVDVWLLSVIPSQVPSRAETGERRYRFGVAGGYAEMLADLESAYDARLLGGVTPPIRSATVVDTAYGAFRPLPFFGAQARDINGDYVESLAYQQERGLYVGGRPDLVSASRS